ncbi:MAG: hypothetical protein V4487_04935 [Chlamydiota bacterium]
MKTLRTLLFLPIAFVSCSSNFNSNAIKHQDAPKSTIKHGQDGRPGQNGENGQDGENGQNGGNGGRGGNSDWGRGGDSPTNIASAQADGQVNEWEYKILRDICRQIIANTISKIHNSSSPSYNESALEAACKQNLSVYLLQAETPAAKKLWQEYEDVKWSYPAITKI